MYHHVAHAVPRTALFRDWLEARVLWDRLARHVPGITALCLMPDHVHLMTSVDSRRRFGFGLRSFARWRNAWRGESGHVFVRAPAPHVLSGREKIVRSERYVHLNPCRAGLVDDPLAWPFSTLRDVVGLAMHPLRQSDLDPEATWAYTVRDTTVRPGVELPVANGVAPTLAQVANATAALCRETAVGLRRRGVPRALFVRAARTLTACTVQEIAEAAGMTRRSVQRVRPGMDRGVRAVERVARDPRFRALEPGDLRWTRGWERYRRLR